MGSGQWPSNTGADIFDIVVKLQIVSVVTRFDRRSSAHAGGIHTSIFVGPLAKFASGLSHRSPKALQTKI